MIFYTRKLQYEHFTPAFWLHNNFCEFSALEHKFKRWFCTQKPISNVHVKDLWYTKIKLSQKCIIFLIIPTFCFSDSIRNRNSVNLQNYISKAFNAHLIRRNNYGLFSSKYYYHSIIFYFYITYHHVDYYNVTMWLALIFAYPFTLTLE